MSQSDTIELFCQQTKGCKTKYFDYSYDTNTDILYKSYVGEIEYTDIANSWDYAIENNSIPSMVKGFIVDYRNASFKMQRMEHQAIAKYYKDHLDIFGNKRIAVITATPKDTVIPILVETLDDGYMSKPFCTEEAALAWVLRRL